MTYLKITGADTETDRENLWTLIVEIYSAFSKYNLFIVFFGIFCSQALETVVMLRNVRVPVTLRQQ